MRGWDWLTKVDYDWRFVARVIIKAVILFVLINLAYALIDPSLGRLSLYNTVLTGRERLPYGEGGADYNLSLTDLDAMFASHVVSQPKADDEFRVLLMGDSSVWGFLLQNDETLAGYINAADIQVAGRQVRAYNLGYPLLSATKDLLLMDYAMHYEPDMIIWLVTLDSFVPAKQLEPPLVQENAEAMRELITTYDLSFDAFQWQTASLLDKTIVGQRREIADWLRLQLYGFLWSTTGIDQLYREYDLRTNDFTTDTTWQGMDESQTLEHSNLALDVLRAGMNRDVPVLLINQPIFIADGENSDLHYNAWYPRWVYDQYRSLLADTAESQSWDYLDLWNLIDRNEFTDSPVHLTPRGSRQLAERLVQAINNRLPSRD